MSAPVDFMEALREMEKYGCSCDVMNGFSCSIHGMARRVLESARQLKSLP